MHIEEIRRFQKAEPFQPFIMRMIDGREYRVPHPDFIHVPPIKNYTWVYVTPRDGLAPEHLNTALIASLRVTPGRQSRPRQRRRGQTGGTGGKPRRRGG